MTSAFDSFDQSALGAFIQSALGVRGGGGGNFIFPSAWCSLVADEPDTTHANESIVASESVCLSGSTATSKSKIVLKYPLTQLTSGMLYYFVGKVSIDHLSWMQSFDVSGFSAASNSIASYYPGVYCTVKYITEDFEPDGLTWNNYAATLTTNAKYIAWSRYSNSFNVQSVNNGIFLSSDLGGNTSVCQNQILAFPAYQPHSSEIYGILIESSVINPFGSSLSAGMHALITLEPTDG